MKSNLIQEFNLPKYIQKEIEQGKFSEASKKISKKFDERTDPYAQETKEELLERLAEAQEYVKMQEETKQKSTQDAMDNNATEVEDQMQGQIPPGMEEFMPQQGQQQEQPMQQPQQGMPQEGMQPQQQMKMGGYTNKYFQGGNLDFLKEFMPDASKVGGEEVKGIYDEANDAKQGADFLEGAGKQLPGKAGAITSGAGQLLDMGNDIFGKTGVDTTGNAEYMKETSEGGAAAKGALKGASTGAQIAGPWGAAVGGAVGGVGSLFGAKAKNKDIEEANMKKDLSVNSKLSNNTFKEGGYTNKYNTNYAGPGVNIGAINRALAEQEVGKGLSKGIETNDKMNTNLMPGTPTKKEGATSDSLVDNESTGDKIKDFTKKYGADAMRMSPVIANLVRAGNLDEAEQVRRQTLDNKYDPQYADVNQMTNKIDENNVNKALTEASGGDMGGLRSSILGANLNKDKAKSDAAIQADQINRAENTKKQQFDTSVDKLNLSQANADLVDNMQNRGARATAKNNLVTQSISDIGAIGKEMQDREIAKEATGYSWDGEYINQGDSKVKPEDIGLVEKNGKLFDKDGNKVSEKEVKKLIEKNK